MQAGFGVNLHGLTGACAATQGNTISDDEPYASVRLEFDGDTAHIFSADPDALERAGRAFILQATELRRARMLKRAGVR